MTLLDRVKQLCKEKGISQGKMEKEIQISNGASSKWKNSSPSLEILKKLSNYFGVSVDYLMNGDEETNGNELTERDKRDIAKDLNNLIELLDSGNDGPVRYNGQVIDDNSRIFLKNALELGLTQLKVENKQLYNPNKNKK